MPADLFYPLQKKKKNLAVHTERAPRGVLSIKDGCWLVGIVIDLIASINFDKKERENGKVSRVRKQHCGRLSLSLKRKRRNIYRQIFSTHDSELEYSARKRMLSILKGD